MKILLAIVATAFFAQAAFCADPARAGLDQLGARESVSVPQVGSPDKASGGGSLAASRPMLASVMSIFLSPKKPPKIEKQFSLYPERSKLPVIGGRNRIIYAASLQPDPSAPLLFISPGLGGYALGGTSQFLAELAYKAGYSVVALPSTTHWSFALAASRSGRTGYLPEDAKDLYRVVQTISMELEREYKIRPSKFALAGYSYGGLDASFLAAEDLRRKAFNFAFVLAINPPLSRVLAIEKVDGYFAEGNKWSEKKREDVWSYAVGTGIDLCMKSPRGGPVNTIEELASRFVLKEDQISWVISRLFRDSLNDSVTVANHIAKASGGGQVSMSGSISDYIADGVTLGAAKEQNRPAAEVAADSELLSVLSRNGALNSEGRFILFHSADDFLSFPEGAAALDSIKGEKHLSPNGGHLGDLANVKTQEGIIGVLAARR